jgi:type I restriction enzyme S subunit
VFSKNISNYKIVSKNQFAYNPSRINIGSISYFKENIQVVVSPLYVVFECREIILPDYLLRFLKSPMGNDEIRDKTRGAVRDSLTFERLGEIFIPLPSLAEQYKISSLLTNIDKLIVERQKSLILIDELLKVHFLSVFGDPNSNSSKWRKLNFSEIVTNENSKRVPINKLERDKRKGDYPYYGATGIIDTIDDYLFDGEFLLIAEDGKNLMLKRKNNAFKASGKFWVNNHAHVLSFNGAANLTYLEFAINNLDLNPYLTGIDQIKLTRENLDKIPIAIPPLEVQGQFEETVKHIVGIKSKINTSINLFRNLYNSLSYSAFTGELNLSNIHLNHIIPLSTGGKVGIENLHIISKDINLKLGNKNESVLKTIINVHFKSRAFNFTELADKIQQGLIEKEYDYDRVKEDVFNCLRGKGEIKLKQILKQVRTGTNLENQIWLQKVQ